MKKILVLLLVTCVSGVAFAQRGMGYDDSRGKRERDQISKDIKDVQKINMPFIKEMPEELQQQLFSIREKFLTEMQEVKQRYEKEELALKLEFKKLGASVDKKGIKFEKDFSLEQAKVMLQAHEIRMKLLDLHRKSRNEADTLKIKMEQESHKIYQAWVNTL